MSARQPYHDWLVTKLDLIARQFEKMKPDGRSNGRAIRLDQAVRDVASDIHHVEIPKGHREILNAWTKMRDWTGWDEDLGVTERLMAAEDAKTEKVATEDA